MAVCRWTFGRVTLLLASGLSMMVCHVIVAFLALSPPSISVGVGILILSCIFVCSFAYGLGPCAWTVCSEIFPMRVRSKGMVLTTASNWLTNTLLGKVFPLLPLAGAFGFFAACCLAGCCMVYLAQPETSSLSLEQIDIAFATHQPRLRRSFWTEARRARSAELGGAGDAISSGGGGSRAVPGVVLQIPDLMAVEAI